MRYNRLIDLGLTEQQIKDNLLFTAEKVGDQMAISANRKDQKQWFGVEPPDLSVIARSRSTDWLYTYLRTFYRDETRLTGWTIWHSQTSPCRTPCGSYRASRPLKLKSKNTAGTNPSTGNWCLKRPAPCRRCNMTTLPGTW